MIQKLIASILPFLPKKFIWMFSKRYIAGENIEDVVKTTYDLDAIGIAVTIDFLGEFVTTLEQARAQKETYMAIIDRFGRQQVNVSLSLKPSSFGLLINEEACYALVREVVIRAAANSRRVRIDMEDSKCVDREIKLYKRIHEEFPHNVGIAIQAYMRRTDADLKNMLMWHTEETPVNIRLCKGIYNEPETIAFKKHEQINAQFLKNLEFLLTSNIFVGIATHDKHLITGALNIINKYGFNEDLYEFQMLYGVTPELGKEIVEKGHPLRVYVPFGKDWFGYSTRRLKENPKMVGQIIKALFVRG
ncbi:proline dehydrogenase family protein [Alkalitalea saponilacus]|uniref:proline dehydrogenase n=1 Tax=Alkalitalea saponilacus TaxID=889453 RepID=A0A1T5BX98_9BACT|nr:proline dehydrogenase family protein [Alkalitalea saponilacus]ASB49561.1 proline dehydrogenase [Alkalitalea saponilacus]SKB51757.1 L-proline dehydrogenase [Alkalitalea saponilacus]